MTFSIVIPSHNQPELLVKCLTSVRYYAPPSTQVIVVDDGSFNASISEATKPFQAVHVIRFAKPVGFCRAANAGIAAATGEVVEMLNDDTQVGPGWADAALVHFQKADTIAVAPLVWQGTPETPNPKIDSAGDGYNPGGYAYKRNFGSTMVPPRGPVWGVSATAGFYRRQVLLKVGGFPNHFGAYFEDVDLSFRLRTLHGRILFEPDSTVWHVGSCSYGKRPNRKTLERQSCNEERVFWRNHAGQTRWKNLPRHTAVVAGKALLRWDEGTLVPWAMGRLRALCGQ